MKNSEIEIRINCYECSPRQYEEACERLDAFFEEYDTEESHSVECGDFEAGMDVLVTVANIPTERLDWANAQINEAMQDIPTWSIDE